MNILNLIGRDKEPFSEDIGSHEKELSEFIVFSKQSTDCHIVVPSGQICANGERGLLDVIVIK
ncbi:hypothetical protein SAMN05444280_1723 [Tangfeifania diversioriginum]|uniref:Uncharacterized protein n=1 Tax=Tangfeifania diversioriginum TaxID=1168035 RepID=A0A1M6PTB1_9BACT|nr:hypothetical protein [Tangfeifania diversioriginum]SHK11148.1 hypothetical protein SAMN05444280_1723 [Tangfeifania diversioriginum]